MRKVLAVIAVLCVVFTAGTALAAQHNGRPTIPPGTERRMPPRMERPQMPPAGHEARAHRPGPGHRTFTPDMPPEIREKAAELAKLKVDLEEAMTSRPLNKEKALEVHAKIQKVKQEIETWRFTRRLERIEAKQKKGLPPAPEETPASEETAGTPENAAPENESKE